MTAFGIKQFSIFVVFIVSTGIACYKVNTMSIEAALNGGAPCVGDICVCKCKKCIALKEKVEAEEKVPWKEMDLSAMEKYFTKEDSEILTKCKNKFVAEIEQFMEKLRRLDHMSRLPADHQEVNEMIRAFIQWEKPSDGVVEELWAIMKREELVDKNLEEMPDLEMEGVRDALEYIWVSYMP